MSRNEFTKEELHELLNRIRSIKGTMLIDDLVCLGMKLQYMIEDYCEHDWNYNQHDMPTNCCKCGKEYR
jgi:hypothetical protein